MDNFQKKGRLNKYLRIPVYFLVLNVILTAGLIICDHSLGIIFAATITAIYAVSLVIYYSYLNSKLPEELISFAIEHATVQKKLLEELQLPYAIIDKEGKLLWANARFKKVIDEENTYLKPITSIFKDLSSEDILSHSEGSFSKMIRHNDREYNALLQAFLVDDSKMNALMLFDETELHKANREIDNQRLVTGLIYIDNYDETIESVEDVKRSMLIAVIERKIQRYFSEADAIIRKLEKDRFFVIFQKKYLEKLEDNSFSLIEDIKNTKVGNEIEVTLSIGIGLGGESYQQEMEFSRRALSLALGRGGSQVVVKNGGDVSYYGSHGKEVDKNTKAKARVKAQALRELISTRERVFVMGHALTDFDALGAGIGIYCASREVGKPCHIIMNEVTRSLRPLTGAFSNSDDYNSDLFINSEQALSMVTDKSLVIVVDTNRPSYTECPQLLENRSVVVFDHHRQGREQIKNTLLSYIEPYASSTCEMIAEILQYYSEKTNIRPLEADCIYSGILIDTNNFVTKTGVRTFEAAAFLRRNGAEVTRVRKLLREDMSAYKARAEIVRNAEVYKESFAFSSCEATDIESPTIVGAQAANELLNIVGMKASFVLTSYNGKVYVSSRSIDEMDVQKIMEGLGGGGHINIAGAQVNDKSLEEVKEDIKNMLDELIEKGDL